MERLEDCISFLVRKAAQQISLRAREMLASWNVTPAQYAVLKALWAEDGQSGAAIGARLVIDSAATTRMIDRLESSGLLKRRAVVGDRRVHLLFLTTQGRALRVPLDAAMNELNAEVDAALHDLAPAVREALRRVGEVRK
jgi:DNA-binding MarR family transcriptional regulator